MKFSSLFHKKEKCPRAAAPVRDSRLYADGSDSSNSGSSHGSGHRRTVVEKLLERQHQQLVEAFRIIDNNRDGKISPHELKLMWANLGEKVSDKELRWMVQEVDVNGDGQIDLQEFITLNRKVGLGFEDPEDYAEELQVAFLMADVNRDGRISAAELQGVMKRLGRKGFTMEESYAMLRCVDSDADDMINYQEFERLMISGVFAGNKL